MFYCYKSIHISHNRIYRQSPKFAALIPSQTGGPMWIFRQSLVHAMVCFAFAPPTHNGTWHYLWYVLFALGTEECVLLMNIFTSWIHSKLREMLSVFTHFHPSVHVLASCSTAFIPTAISRCTWGRWKCARLNGCTAQASSQTISHPGKNDK